MARRISRKNFTFFRNRKHYDRVSQSKFFATRQAILSHIYPQKKFNQNRYRVCDIDSGINRGFRHLALGSSSTCEAFCPHAREQPGISCIIIL